MKKTIGLILLFLIASFNLYANLTNELVLNLDHSDSNDTNLSRFIDTHKQMNHPTKIVFEFTDSKSATFFKAQTKSKAEIQQQIYNTNYPNGDFYYLIGDLDNAWTESDYAKFYSVAKWLAIRGFRTIINVAAFEPDLQEAISNSKTSAIIWNSHGRADGTIIDTAKVAINDNIFKTLRTPRLKYVLFANCWGLVSTQKYGLTKMQNILSLGWNRTVTSDDLFRYIFSTDFDSKLSEALGKDIKKKPVKQVEI